MSVQTAKYVKLWVKIFQSKLFFPQSKEFLIQFSNAVQLQRLMCQRLENIIFRIFEYSTVYRKMLLLYVHIFYIQYNNSKRTRNTR